MDTPQPLDAEELRFAADTRPPSSAVGYALDPAAQKYAALATPMQPYTYINSAGQIVWQSIFRDSLDTQKVHSSFYDDLLVRYGHAGSVFRKRVNALTLLPLRVRPAAGKDTPQARARADRTRATIFGIRNISRSLALLIETYLLKGFAPHQIVPQARRGALRVNIAELLWLDPTMVYFHVNGHMFYRSSVGAWHGTDLTDARPGQFFAPSFRSNPGNPYGIGLGEDILRPFWLTVMGAVRAWAAGCERLGIPVRDVAVPQEIAESAPKMDKIRVDATSLNRDAVWVHDDRVTLTFLQANAAGMADTFEKFCRYNDEIVSKIVLGETLTTDTAARGSSEVATGHREVRQEVCDADAAALAEWLTECLVGYIEQVNEGVDDPSDWSQVVIGEELSAPKGQDLAAAGDLLVKARKEGVPVTIEAWQRLGVPEPGADETLLPPVSATPPGGADPFQFAAPAVVRNRQALEDAAVRPLVTPYRGLIADLMDDLSGKA